MQIERYPKTIDLTADNMLYRGNVFYGTQWVVGLVVYTGLEAKTYLNTQRPRKKMSRMERIERTERTVSRWVVYILVVLLVVVIFSSLASIYLASSNSQSFNENFIALSVLYNNIFPNSLIVVIGIVRIKMKAINYKINKILINKSRFP